MPRSIAVDADRRRVDLDRTAFYATGGGQPHDTGTLGGQTVVDVQKEGEHVWHSLSGDGPLPVPGDRVHGEIEWARRHALMRTHTALHVLCGVIWNEWGKAVTGGNMEPLNARMDFEFDPLPEGFGARVEELVNAELAAARPIQVSFLPRGTAVMDEDLIRTKVNMIPESVDRDPALSTSSALTNRPTEAPTYARRTKWAGSGCSRPSPKERATSASGSRLSTANSIGRPKTPPFPALIVAEELGF